MTGAIALGLLVLLLGYLYGVRDVSNPTGSTVAVEAVFNRVDGLAERDAVYLSGVRVGTVGAMRLDDNFRAIVTLNLDGGLQVPNDSTASIQTDGLFGDKFIIIEPGSEERFFKTGDRIIFTEDAVVVGDLMELIISEGKARLAGNEDEAAK